MNKKVVRRTLLLAIVIVLVIIGVFIWKTRIDNDPSYSILYNVNEENHTVTFYPANSLYDISGYHHEYSDMLNCLSDDSQYTFEVVNQGVCYLTFNFIGPDGYSSNETFELSLANSGNFTISRRNTNERDFQSYEFVIN